MANICWSTDESCFLRVEFADLSCHLGHLPKKLNRTEGKYHPHATDSASASSPCWPCTTKKESSNRNGQANLKLPRSNTPPNQRILPTRIDLEHARPRFRAQKAPLARRLGPLSLPLLEGGRLGCLTRKALGSNPVETWG